MLLARFRVALDEVDTLDHHFIFFGDNGLDNTGFTLVLAEDYDDFIVATQFHYSTSGASEIIFM
jgi:hypothetical protein